MSEAKSRSKLWIMIGAVAVLFVAVAYLIINSSASADVVNKQSSGYQFEIVSKSKIIPIQVGTNQYRIFERITPGSGFGVRVRDAKNKNIVKRDLRWVTKTGFVSLDAKDSFVVLYPVTLGAHYLYVEIGSGSQKTRLNLEFATDGFNNNSPTASTTSTAVTPTPTGTANDIVTVTPTSSGTANVAVTITPNPVGTAVTITPAPTLTGTCTVDASGNTICS